MKYTSIRCLLSLPASIQHTGSRLQSYSGDSLQKTIYFQSNDLKDDHHCVAAEINSSVFGLTMFDDEDRSNSSGGGRRVDNLGPILLSPGGTFNMPADTGFNMGFSEPADKSSADDDVSQTNNSSANTESNPASDSNYQLIKRDLFGGAISMQIPGSFQDVSTMREVWKRNHAFLK